MNNKPRFVGEKVRLGELCRPKQWKSLKQSDMTKTGYPVYGANGIIGHYSEYNHENETILVGCRGTCGEINICKPKSYVTSNAMCLDALSERIDSRFLVCFLKAYDFGKVIGGTSQPQITKSGISSIEVPVFPIEVQLEIASRFEAILFEIEKCNSVLDCLDQIVKSRFVEMFGNCQNRVRLSEVCGTFNGDRGKNYPSGNDRTDEGVPFVNAGHLKNGRVLFDEMDYITEERYELLSGGKIQRGDLLYCLRGSLGKCAIADFDRGTIASSMMIIRPDRTKIMPLFLYQVLTSPDIDRQLKLSQNGSSQPNLSAKSVGNYLIPLPNLNDQQGFTDFVSQANKPRFVAQQQIEKLQTLYDSLAQEYFGD